MRRGGYYIMIIYCDRNDGIFTPQMSDRINVKSDNLYEKINGISVTPIYPHVDVDSLTLNVANNPMVDYVVDNSLVINHHLYVINVTVTCKQSYVMDHFVKIGDLNVPPVTDIICQYDDGALILKVEKGQTSIQLMGNLGMQPSFYFYYVV